MQQEQIILPSGVSVRDPAGERYVIETLLGEGGSGAVYLVRDQSPYPKRFALKEVINPDKHDRERFTFEGQVLWRLEHRALPRVYRVFENDKLRRVYMLMDYIEGPNLEVLQKGQPEQRFPLALSLALLAPIIEALTYLHHQDPPIVHRDVKPANIIVPMKGEGAMLVDFGLAKEFVEDKTTSVIRHGSPGYAALEQYGKGTTPRTDIYGLGATFHTLLTGTVPIDAVSRATESKGIDPLAPASIVTADVPTAIAKTLRRAMRMSSDDRFSTVEEFWQELTIDFPQVRTTSPRIPAFHPMEPGVSALPAGEGSRSGTPIRKRVVSTPLFYRQQVPRWRQRGILLPMLLALLLIGIIGTTSLWYTLVYGRHPSPIARSTTTPATASPRFTSTPKISNFPIIASSYVGTVGD